ncbi:MAG: LytTR family transcriptional regulator DNA-binding domain-containing protein [Flavobacteriales bacterium]
MQNHTLLKDSQFFRVHKIHLINFRHVKSYERQSGMAVMKDGSKIDVARRRKDDFLSQFAVAE